MELHHFRKRYQRYAAEECLLQMGGVLCPDGRTLCLAGLLPEDDRRMIQCLLSNGLGCRFVFCCDCKEGFHEGACGVRSAPVTGGALQVTEPISYVLLTDALSLLPPYWGCMHMVCLPAQCKFEWECMGNHWFG
uniref:IBR domain-containing protein n=1 Tax=Hucho hucho TaxID=62062 RepID=A0A4W5MER0_9TELE